MWKKLDEKFRFACKRCFNDCFNFPSPTQPLYIWSLCNWFLFAYYLNVLYVHRVFLKCDTSNVFSWADIYRGQNIYFKCCFKYLNRYILFGKTVEICRKYIYILKHFSNFLKKIYLWHGLYEWNCDYSKETDIYKCPNM